MKGLETDISLPSSALISGDLAALEAYTKATIHMTKNPNDLEASVALLEKSIEEDPTCSWCFFGLGMTKYTQGNYAECIPLMQQAVKYGKSLPERMQFQSKQLLYLLTNKMESFVKLQEMHLAMYPYDFGPYAALQEVYKTNYGLDSAQALMQKAIDNGILEYGLLNLANLQLENEEYDAAEQTLNRFSEEFPDRDQDRMRYARIYENQGRIEDAKEIYLREETLDPFNTSVQRRLANLDFNSLNIDAAFERIERSLSEASTTSDSSGLFITLRRDWTNR